MSTKWLEWCWWRKEVECGYGVDRGYRMDVWMDGVEVALDSRVVTVEAARQDRNSGDP